MKYTVHEIEVVITFDNTKNYQYATAVSGYGRTLIIPHNLHLPAIVFEGEIALRTAFDVLTSREGTKIGYLAYCLLLRRDLQPSPRKIANYLRGIEGKSFQDPNTYFATTRKAARQPKAKSKAHHASAL